jgi:hypothetical protein
VDGSGNARKKDATAEITARLGIPSYSGKTNCETQKSLFHFAPMIVVILEALFS